MNHHHLNSTLGHLLLSIFLNQVIESYRCLEYLSSVCSFPERHSLFFLLLRDFSHSMLLILFSSKGYFWHLWLLKACRRLKAVISYWFAIMIWLKISFCTTVAFPWLSTFLWRWLCILFLRLWSQFLDQKCPCLHLSINSFCWQDGGGSFLSVVIQWADCRDLITPERWGWHVPMPNSS